MFQPRQHHLRDDVCINRPPYRDGRKPRAVKVYTIVQESKYLLVQNVPPIGGVLEQLLPLFTRFGQVEQHWPLYDYNPDDDTSETILIKFAQIQRARIAKCRLDDYNFLGTNLHVCYAPECESFDDLKEKIAERRSIVTRKSQMNMKSNSSSSPFAKFLLPPAKKISQDSSFERTTNEIRQRIREAVQKSNLIPLVLQQKKKQKKIE